jgi:dipeptidyl aminopeptidase/acylaminoacyl peptidase
MHRRGTNNALLLALAAALIVLSVATPSALAQPPALIPRAILFGNPEKALPAISPDGSLLAYLSPDQGVLNVWVRTLGQQDDYVITSDRKRGIGSFYWRQDSAHILYRQDQNGDENWHLYQTNLKTRETRDLTPFKNVRTDVISFDPRFPDQMLVQMNKRDPAVFDAYRLDLKSGKAELDTQNPGDVDGWGADNKQQIRAMQGELPDGSAEVRVRDDVRSPWRILVKLGADDSASTQIYGFSPDNLNLWLVSSAGANAARLIEVNLATAKQNVLAADEQYDVETALIDPRKHTLEAVRFVRARSEWTLIDQTLKPDFDALSKVRDGDFDILSRDFADKTWIVAYLVDNGPVFYYAYNRRTRRAQLLFSSRPALEKYTLARMQPVSFQARDGMTIYGYLTLPLGVEPKGLPMVLFVHGGPWARDTWGLNRYVQWLANRGYAVMQVNYRGSTGYGKKYLLAAIHEWAGKMHDDLIDGVNWAVRQGYVDPKRVGIMGASYGGYATLVGLTFTPEVFACGVDIVGPSNLVTLIKTVPPYWQTYMGFFHRHIGNPDDPKDAEDMKARSPLYKVDRIKAPLLIGQGGNDPRVNQAESEQIVAAMRKVNKPVEYILYTDEGHGFVRPENNLHFNAKAEEFLAKYLGGRFEPAGEIKGHSGVMK